MPLALTLFGVERRLLNNEEEGTGRDPIPLSQPAVVRFRTVYSSVRQDRNAGLHKLQASCSGELVYLTTAKANIIPTQGHPAQNRGLLKETDVADTSMVPVHVTTDSSVWNLGKTVSFIDWPLVQVS